MTTLDEIFVFGSNLAGIHGKGAALHARQYYGAKYGEGKGLTGHAYALPTKRTPRETLPLSEIRKHINEFIDFAEAHPEKRFLITRVGCGLAGYSWSSEIRPCFPDPLPNNCTFAWPE